MAIDAVAVVRDAWDAYSAGDVDKALRCFAPDAVWHVASDLPGPSVYTGHDELRALFDAARNFSVHNTAVTEVADMGAFVLAHGVVYLECDGTVVVDRVTIWRCRVAGDVILSVHAEALPAGARWQEPHRSASQR